MTSGRPDWYDQVIIGGSDVTLPISIEASAVTLNVAIQSSVTLNVAIQSSAVTLDVNIASSAVTLDVKITGSDVTLNVNANVTNSYIYVRTETAQNLNVDITAQSVGNLDVNIAASAITLNVAIQSSAVTFDVNITGSSVTLNVNVTGTASVSIDNATVYLNIKNEAFTVINRTIKNNGNTVVDYNTSSYRGKYFPHGVRGIIRYVKLYVKDIGGGGGTIQYRLCIAPDMPAVYTYTVSISAGTEGWVTSYIHRRWDYDSIFVEYIVTSGTIGLAYDEGSPWDAYQYYGGTGTYSMEYRRYWIQMFVSGQTQGDIPVSGTINTINIPNETTTGQTALETIPAGTEVSLVSIQGTGKLKFLRVLTDWENMFFRIYIDGTMIQYADTDCTFSPFLTEQDEQTRPSRVVYCTTYDTANNMFVVEWLVELEFKKRIEIRAYNYDTASHGAQILYTIASKIT